MQQHFESAAGKTPEKGSANDAASLFNFIEELPEEIPGSQKNYHKTEIQTLVSEVLYGSKSLERITNTFGIHDAVRTHMRARVVAAEQQFPEYADAQFHPMTGKPLATFEDRFHLADYLLRTKRLSDRGQEWAIKGLDDVSPAMCAKYYNEVFVAEGGTMRSSPPQTHMYFENPDIAQNRQENKSAGINPNIDLDEISNFESDFKKAQIQGDVREMGRMQQEADSFLQSGGAARLACEYKFHVSIPPNALPLFLDRILQAIKTDPYLKKNLIAFKVNTIINENDNGALIPDIVMYPRRTRTAQTARANALVLSERLKAHLADLESPRDHVGVPRYNYQATPSLAIAQSGGDLKNSLKTMGLLDKYFDGDHNHALFRPEFTR